LEKGSVMCTVSWIHEERGYQLFCNRDERHTRQPALPPRERRQRGVLFIAPVDGDHSGSWIGVNQFGLSLCLLNRYHDEGQRAAAPPYMSRGLLVNELMDCQSRCEAQSRIEPADLTRYRPFTLLALEIEEPPLVVEWTGRKLLIERYGELAMPLTSSSLDPKGVSLSRHQHFNSLVAASGKIDSSLLCAFHASHFPSASAYSTCMHRDDAHTVSFSRIKVTRSRIEFLYHADAPCRPAPITRIDLRFTSKAAPKASR
jgi:hypothetical protein